MPLPVSLAAEGLLDEQMLKQLLIQSGRPYVPGACYGKRGRDDLRLNVPRFNQAARHRPFIILADLEMEKCASELLNKWLPGGHHENLVLRIAVRMVESWLLADTAAFARFLGVTTHLIPQQPDQVMDPKSVVVNLAHRSRLRTIRADLVPAPNSTSRIGKNYAGRLTEFVQTQWQAGRARLNSPSLDRAMLALEKFRPI